MRRLHVPDAEIVYDVHAGPGPAILLIHGWACRRSDWDAVISSWPGQRHAIAVDLPWHGESTSTRTSWSIADFGDVVAAVAAEEDLPEVILVGHSLGGAVAVEAAHRLGSAARQVIGLDCFVQLFLYPRQDEPTVQAAVAGFRSNYPGAVRSLVESTFASTSDRELMEDVIAEMTAVKTEPAVAALESLYRWDQDAALSQGPTPVSVLAALATAEARERYERRIQITQVDLGGHFFLREQPQQTSAAILDQI